MCIAQCKSFPSSSLTCNSENPSGFAWAGATGLYLALIPVSNYITSDGGVLQRVAETVLGFVPGCSNLPKDRIIPALGALYLFSTFAASGAASVAGQAVSRKEGLDNDCKVPLPHRIPLIAKLPASMLTI